MTQGSGKAIRAAIVAVALGGCMPMADIVDGVVNGIGDLKPKIEHPDFHNSLMVADLHADTLLWHRGLRDYATWGQVDLNRLRAGNVGLQVFTIVTRNPLKDQLRKCVPHDKFDPVPLLAFANGWRSSSYNSPFERALKQVEALEDALTRKRTSGIELMHIKSLNDLTDWRDRRFPGPGRINHNVIGAILGVEGAHAFNTDLGSEFRTLYDRGLRLVGPMHHFDNRYGGSSETCYPPGPALHDPGRELVAKMLRLNMIIDVAHASTPALREIVAIAKKAGRPVLVSHTGIRGQLESHHGDDRMRHQLAISRAMPSDDIKLVAETGGTVGIIYWKDQIGEAKVDNVVAAIRRAYCDLAADFGGNLQKASEHISLGSDWDGAALNAVDAAHVGAITGRLKQLGLPDSDIANIAGLNACRVIAQSLAGTTMPQGYEDAKKLCLVNQLERETTNDDKRKIFCGWPT